jgi:cytosine/adenosine deaminase-related metal-dependent hydrolase
MPGLIDTYGHAGHGLVKGIHHPRLGWPNNQIYFHATTDEWWYAEGALSALERLKFGVTCGFSVLGATPARMDSPIFAERQAEAVSAVGIRGVLGVGPPDPFVHHLDEPWSGTFWENGRAEKREFTYLDTIRNSVAVIEKLHGEAEGRVRVALHYPYLFGRQSSHPAYPFQYRDEHVPDMLEKAEEMKELADKFGVILHSHALRGSIRFGMERFGMDRVQNLLGGDVVLVHCNGLEEQEVRVLGEQRVSIAVVPFTQENVLYGPCPVIELLRTGANVTISTDGSAPYTSYDLLKEIPRAISMQWSRFGDETLLPPGKALRMVTIDAARALGLDSSLGSLEVGKKADVILVDLNKPHLTPSLAAPRLVAYYASGNDVDTVLVDGKVLMQNRRVKSVDENAVLDMAREQAALAFSRSEIEPYLEMDDNFWQDWKYGGEA